MDGECCIPIGRKCWYRAICDVRNHFIRRLLSQQRRDRQLTDIRFQKKGSKGIFGKLCGICCEPRHHSRDERLLRVRVIALRADLSGADGDYLECIQGTLDVLRIDYDDAIRTCEVHRSWQ
jgi:hypothetical protein